MTNLRKMLKAVGLPRLMQPCRGIVTWAGQRGIVSSDLLARHVPWSWVLEPFTIYGDDWRVRWFPTEFDSIGHRLFFTGLREWEKETSPIMLEQIRRSRCFIDIGANCGVYTVFGCAVSPSVHVVAVEPVPRICAALANNVRQNGYDSRVTILNMALGECNGTVSFHEADVATMGSLAVDGYRGQHGRVIEVNCRTLDSVVKELSIEPDLLKIDVEGFEDVVLNGASEVLTRFRPCIILEANPGDPADRMTEILLKHGYRFQSITDRGLEERSEITPMKAYRNWRCSPAS